ncbi:MAG: hypothetical protein JO001_14175 [Alphaproteobacteria bacterium]|nr:hypothetical protein [Alphaproteobacteria bacterium]
MNIPVNGTVQWLFLDLNAFFASCEQQKEPGLRSKPIVVVQTLTESAVAIAASYPAKRLGITTGTVLRDARRICREVVAVPANHAPYTAYHDQREARTFSRADVWNGAEPVIRIWPKKALACLCMNPLVCAAASCDSRQRNFARKCVFPALDERVASAKCVKSAEQKKRGAWAACNMDLPKCFGHRM